MFLRSKVPIVGLLAYLISAASASAATFDLLCDVRDDGGLRQYALRITEPIFGKPSVRLIEDNVIELEPHIDDTRIVGSKTQRPAGVDWLDDAQGIVIMINRVTGGAVVSYLGKRDSDEKFPMLNEHRGDCKKATSPF